MDEFRKAFLLEMKLKLLESYTASQEAFEKEMNNPNRINLGIGRDDYSDVDIPEKFKFTLAYDFLYDKTVKPVEDGQVTPFSVFYWVFSDESAVVMVDPEGYGEFNVVLYSKFNLPQAFRKSYFWNGIR